MPGTLTNDQMWRRWKARRTIQKYTAYMASLRLLLQDAIAHGDAPYAYRHARNLAGAAGYVAWVQAKLDGHPFLAPMSARREPDWSNIFAPISTTAASTTGALDDGGGA